MEQRLLPGDSTPKPSVLIPTEQNPYQSYNAVRPPPHPAESSIGHYVETHTTQHIPQSQISYVLHMNSSPESYDSIQNIDLFAKTYNAVKCGIYYDMIVSFLYFVFNPFFLFYSFFNLLFSYLGLRGLRSSDTTYLGSYSIYMFMKLAFTISYFVFICVNHEKIFASNDVAYHTCIGLYSCFSLLYIYYYVNLITYIRFLLQ